jgi:hypothetical protein
MVKLLDRCSTRRMTQTTSTSINERLGKAHPLWLGVEEFGTGRPIASQIASEFILVSGAADVHHVSVKIVDASTSAFRIVAFTKDLVIHIGSDGKSRHSTGVESRAGLEMVQIDSAPNTLGKEGTSAPLTIALTYPSGVYALTNKGLGDNARNSLPELLPSLIADLNRAH